MKDLFMFGPVYPTSYSFTLREGKVQAVNIGFVTEVFGRLVTALTEKYGKPTQDEAEVVQNRMGTKFDNRKLKWDRPDGIMLVSKYGSDLTRGYFFMSSHEYLAEEKRKTVDDAKASASKL